MTVEVLVAVCPESAVARAMPKSITLTAPVVVSITLPGLDVAVDDAVPVAVVQRREDAGGDLQRALGDQLVAGAQQLLEGDPLDSSITMNGTVSAVGPSPRTSSPVS